MEEKELTKLEKYRQKVSIDPWREKLYDFQDRSRQEKEALDELFANLKPEEEAKLPEEEQKQRKEEFAKEYKQRRANINTLKEVEEEHRLNKTMSSFFEYEKNKNLNRRQRRALAKMRGKQ
jgi:methionyl-tRNA formyltransferase